MANVAAEVTHRLLAGAGIAAGQRILDVGCGQGVVTFMLAEILGESGEVTGVDRDSTQLALAEARRRELGLSNVAFLEGDLIPPSPEAGPFDAAVARRVLMYQPDRVEALRRVACAVRPGGVIALQEHDSTNGPSLAAALPLHAEAHRWVWETVRREGADTTMGSNLHAVLRQAGFEVLDVRAEAILLTPMTDYPVAHIVQAMRDRILRAEVATEAELGLDTLEERLRQELRKQDRTCVWDMAYLGWARKPA